MFIDKVIIPEAILPTIDQHALNILMEDTRYIYQHFFYLYPGVSNSGEVYESLYTNYTHNEDSVIDPDDLNKALVNLMTSFSLFYNVVGNYVGFLRNPPPGYILYIDDVDYQERFINNENRSVYTLHLLFEEQNDNHSHAPTEYQH